MIKCPYCGSSDFWKTNILAPDSASFGYNNAVESEYSLLKDFIRAKRGFKKFSNIPKYINGWVYIHNLFKDLGSDKYAIIQSLLALSR